MRRAAAVALAALLAGACEWDYERMVDQQKFSPYEPNPYFADGATAQRPPPGTVARSAVLGPPALVDGRRAGAPVERIPVPVTRALVARGRDRFAIFCAPCHGRLGDADTVVARDMTLRPPPSLHEARLVAVAPGHLYRVIAEGYGLMPSYGEELPVADRWAVVAWVQALQLSQGVPLAELPPDLAEEARPWLK